jgi:hypothetical protein
MSISNKCDMKRKNQTSIMQFSKKREKIQFLEVDGDEIMDTKLDSQTNVEKENEVDSLPVNEINV